MSKPGESEGAANYAERGEADNAADPATPDEFRVVDRVDYDPEYDPTRAVLCEVCGTEMYYTAACKLKCPRCGYTRDCSDP